MNDIIRNYRSKIYKDGKRMNQQNRNMLSVIKDSYDRFTNLEVNIADFFLSNQDEIELTSKGVAKRLFVSEASLSRFAKKCGFKGFREFLYYYEDEIKYKENEQHTLIHNYSDIYQSLVSETIELIQEDQINRLANLLLGNKSIFVYGIGLSGITAMEFKVHFMKLGCSVEVVMDSYMMGLTEPFVNNQSIMIGISVDGETEQINDVIQSSWKKGAYTVLFTSNKNYEYKKYCSDILYLPKLNYKKYKTEITSRFSLGILFEILYAYCLDKQV